jgi:hypothetical protein
MDLYMSSRSRRAFLVTALQDADAWVRFVAHAGFVVEEAPLGPDGTTAAEEGTVLLVLRQTTELPGAASPPPAVLRPLGPGSRRRRSSRDR